MNFLKELESHLETFETEAKAEIQSFITYVKSKYQTPTDAVVAPPAPIAPNGELTIGQAAPAVEAEAAPVQEEPAEEAVVDIPAETEEQAAQAVPSTTCAPAEPAATPAE